MCSAWRKEVFREAQLELIRVCEEVIKRDRPRPIRMVYVEMTKTKGERWNKIFRLEIGGRLDFCGGGRFFHYKYSQAVEKRFPWEAAQPLSLDVKPDWIT